MQKWTAIDLIEFENRIAEHFNSGKIQTPIHLDTVEDILDTYVHAANRSDGVSFLIIEWSDRYSD